MLLTIIVSSVMIATASARAAGISSPVLSGDESVIRIPINETTS